MRPCGEIPVHSTPWLGLVGLEVATGRPTRLVPGSTANWTSTARRRPADARRADIRGHRRRPATGGGSCSSEPLRPTRRGSSRTARWPCSMCSRTASTTASGSSRRIVEMDPRRWAAHTMIGIILRKQGRHRRRYQQYQKGLAIDPRCRRGSQQPGVDLRRSRASCSRKDSGWRDRARSKMPIESAVSDTIGWLYYKLRQPARRSRT